MIRSPQSAPPVSVYFRQDGAVVLIDEWYQAGRKSVVCVIDPSGTVKATYDLRDVLTPAEIVNCPSTLTSTYWAKGAAFFFREEDRQFCFQTAQGVVRSFDMTTGALVPLSKAEIKEIAGEAFVIQKVRLRSLNSTTRLIAAKTAGTLGNPAFVPHLVALLDDPYSVPFDFVVHGKLRHFFKHPIRTSAGMSLVQILGDQAATYIEPKIANPDKSSADNWRGVLRAAGGHFSLRMLDKYAKNRRAWESR